MHLQNIFVKLLNLLDLQNKFITKVLVIHYSLNVHIIRKHSLSLSGELYSGDITEVYPLTRIEQEVREQKDMFGSLDLHETYYKVCVCVCVCVLVCTCVCVLNAMRALLRGSRNYYIPMITMVYMSPM